MCTERFDNSQRQTIRERYREWLPGLSGAVLLFIVAESARFADRHRVWFKGHYELLDIVAFVTIVGAFCLFGVAMFRIAGSRDDQQSIVTRIALTIFLVAVSFKVGTRYLHLCHAGSRSIEFTAVFGLPILIGAMVFIVNRPKLASALTTCVLIVVWLLARPYLDWVHGNW